MPAGHFVIQIPLALPRVLFLPCVPFTLDVVNLVIFGSHQVRRCRPAIQREGLGKQIREIFTPRQLLRRGPVQQDVFGRLVSPQQTLV